MAWAAGVGSDWVRTGPRRLVADAEEDSDEAAGEPGGAPLPPGGSEFAAAGFPLRRRTIAGGFKVAGDLDLARDETDEEEDEAAATAAACWRSSRRWTRWT